jgi:hypothetical protein
MTEASDLNDSEGEETAAVFMGIGRQKASSLASDHTIKPARLLACCGQILTTLVSGFSPEALAR